MIANCLTQSEYKLGDIDMRAMRDYRDGEMKQKTS